MGLPLSGVRVLAIEQFGAGPFATLQLADLGAEVVKIEDPSTGGDVGRYVPPFQEADASLFFEALNRNKKSVALDLASPEGRAVFEDLVRGADVVFSNLRGDVPAKLRITYDDLAPINPAIVCCSLSGFGMTGPRAKQGGYDYMMQGLAGWMALTGEPDGPPTKTGLSLVDLSGGLVAAIAMLAGLTRARQEGVGCDCDIALFETALSLLSYVGTWAATEGWEPKRMAESAHPSIVPFQAFPASDGWLVVACAKEKFWQRLCPELGLPELPDDPRFADFAARDANREVLLPLLRAAFRERTVDDWVERLVAAGVPAAPVQTVNEALLDPQVEARGMVVTTEHPRFGEVRSIASPLHLSGDEVTPRRAPLQGEHTREALAALGYDDAQVDALAAVGAVRDGSAGVSAMAPKEWLGRFFEDLEVGDVFRSRLGRTISETDNTWFTCLTMNTNQLHFNAAYAEGTRFGRVLVNSALTVALVSGLSVPDTSENAAANLSWTDIRLPAPVYVGDTIWAESEILTRRESSSNPEVGIIGMRTRGINQRREVICEFERTFMLYRRTASAVSGTFPVTEEPWRVGPQAG